MFALGIRYLTGYAVATDVSNRERAEWPPHPARVFMALAAAHFETGEDSDEKASLAWLEQQGPPTMSFSESNRRDVVKHYVPVNDKAVRDKTKTMLQSATNVPRDRKERFFPRVRPVNDTVHLLWAESEPSSEYRAAMSGLCRKVIRIGHSSSLVQMWVEDKPPASNWFPDAEGGLRLRVLGGDGTLEYLKERFRVARRPVSGLWQSYREIDSIGGVEAVASGSFDRDIMVLAIQDGPVVGLETSWQLLTAVRDTILKLCHPAPEWISGHQQDKSPSQDTHLAVLPLAFVGYAHADGHLLGVGLAFPKRIPPRERGAALRNLLYDKDGQPKAANLMLGRLGAWSLIRETRESPPLALQGRTWTGPSHTWATVTPIVLDHHPKADYQKQREQWNQEATEIIAESCRIQGLPPLLGVGVGKTCWHRGAPRAIPGKVGFPLVPVKPGTFARQQVHAWLEFEREVQGPLLLGAGRYRGYGLCKPWRGGDQ